VQLAAILTRDNGEEISHAKLLIQPCGWGIDPGAEAVHGISLEHATNAGINVMAALSLFHHMASRADSFHAFNYAFDSLIMAVEYHHAGKSNPLLLPDKGWQCEMEAMTNTCKLPPKYRGTTYKWPSLQEAYRHCCKKDFDGAHDALADVRAMIAVHKWRLENNILG
jgi:DNA polymerase III subunit epsilon